MIDKKHKDDEFVYKYGMTDSLVRRIEQHKLSFGKISKTDLRLVAYGMIDPQYVSKAETKIKHLFQNMEVILEHDTFEELIVLPTKKIKFIKSEYASTSELFMGHIKELTQQIKEKDHEIIILNEKHTKEIAGKNIELLKKNNEVELLKKDI